MSKRIQFPVLLLLSTFILVIVSYHRPMQEYAAPLPTLQQVSSVAWDQLAQKRIWFGHASVGANILQGIEALEKDHPEIKLNIIANETPWTIQTPGLIHFSSLPNPKLPTKILTAKIDHFSQLMQASTGHPVDIAFFELCWADVKPDTDISQVFSHYQQTMEKLIQDFPNTTFVHITMPLVAEPSGMVAFKNWIKQIIGKPPFHLSDNVKINQFNDLLRSHYSGKAPVFDLAQIESTFPDGKKQTFTQNNQQYFALVPDYTDDMGHLNSVGRRIVAEQFLTFLANQSLTN